MKKALTILAAYAAGILTSTLALEKLGAHITWFAPWIHDDQKYVLKKDYMSLWRRYSDLRLDFALKEGEYSEGYEDGYDDGCMDMLDDDPGSIIEGGSDDQRDSTV